MNYTSLIKKKKLAWGAQVLATEFPAHDTISIVGSLLGGSRLAGDEELADVHAAMLLEGTKKRNKKKIQEQLDDIGANLVFSTQNDRLVFSGRVRVEHADKFFGLISDVLKASQFPQRELKALKARKHAELLLESQDTRAQADISLVQLLYTKGHPNWHEKTQSRVESLHKISSRALKKYHAEAIDKASLVFSIAGDIKPMHAFKLVDKHFKALPSRKLKLPPFDRAQARERMVDAVPVHDKENVDYMIGIATGIIKKNPDFLPLSIGVHILGKPGFSGRLMKTVREIEGLTYVAYAYLSGFKADGDGYIQVWSTFAPTLFKKGRAGILREVGNLFQKGVTDEEAKIHREMMAANHKVQLSNSGAFARLAHDITIDGRNISYLDEFPKLVLKISKDQINKALTKYLRPEMISESAAGPVDKNIFA
ncbi:MAG TPA: insulinase family protein [Candidatus Paceibacterota bacterium]|nr:insulinase family protein [Candidatus Paceibacterota bacterium]